MANPLKPSAFHEIEQTKTTGRLHFLNDERKPITFRSAILRSLKSSLGSKRFYVNLTRDSDGPWTKTTRYSGSFPADCQVCALLTDSVAKTQRDLQLQLSLDITGVTDLACKEDEKVHHLHLPQALLCLGFTSCKTFTIRRGSQHAYNSTRIPASLNAMTGKWRWSFYTGMTHDSLYELPPHFPETKLTALISSTEGVPVETKAYIVVNCWEMSEKVPRTLSDGPDEDLCRRFEGLCREDEDLCGEDSGYEAGDDEGDREASAEGELK